MGNGDKALKNTGGAIGGDRLWDFRADREFLEGSAISKIKTLAF